MVERFHTLLRRQVKRCFGTADHVPATVLPFLNMVNDAYQQADVDRLMLERSLALSSEELGDANSQLRLAVQDLQAAHRDMEARVADRTRDLEAVHAHLRQSQKMEAIGRLAGGIAHDFNNLLTAMLGYTELVLERVHQDRELTADVGEIKKACERASRLTHQLLAFSRKQVLQLQVLDLNQVVVELELMLSRVIGEDIRLELATATSLDHTRVDRSQVEQLLMNLVVNARDAMPEGGTLRITTANVELTADFVRDHAGANLGRHVSVAVRDTGCGMAPEILAHIFEPFFTTKGPGQGTGLGLATVYGIVKQSGGYVTVDSEVGTGTTVTAYLPAVDDPIDGANTTDDARGATGTETILLVEDEATVRALLRKRLTQSGYRILEAGNGVEAMAVAERYLGPIQLLLTDVVMPEMNGPTLARHLVSVRPDMKVLYVSGFPQDSIPKGGSLNPGESFLAKPFTFVTLMAAVRASLQDSPSNSSQGLR